MPHPAVTQPTSEQRRTHDEFMMIMLTAITESWRWLSPTQTTAEMRITRQDDRERKHGDPYVAEPVGEHSASPPRTRTQL